MKELTLSGGVPLSVFADPLCAWYRENARPLPWREDATPYRVLLSEIMLQQTRIEAVKPYYARFLAAAPTVADLAALPDDRLMKLWEGLGYYSRARNLKKAAILLCERYGGELPADYAALLTLPGVGEYTAGAIASIAYGLPCPAVDGNVLRVIARLSGLRDDVLHPATKKRVTEALFPVYAACPDPAALTQGLMELGETLCPPGKSTHCGACPLAPLCRAYGEGSVGEIPYRAPKKEKKALFRLILLLCDEEGKYALHRRPGEGLLAGLWELPGIELPALPSDEEAEELARRFCREHGLVPGESAAAPTGKHVFTHLVWHMAGRYVNVKRTGATDGALHFASPGEIKGTCALPTAFRTYTRVIHGEEI